MKELLQQLDGFSGYRVISLKKGSIIHKGVARIASNTAHILPYAVKALVTEAADNATTDLYRTGAEMVDVIPVNGTYTLYLRKMKKCRGVFCPEFSLRSKI